VERALTRFIAKTGKIHKLFNTEDSNLFPLISCEKDEEGTRLPAYIDALIFKVNLLTGTATRYRSLPSFEHSQFRSFNSVALRFSKDKSPSLQVMNCEGINEKISFDDEVYLGITIFC